MSEEEIKKVAKVIALSQIEELAKFIQSDRIKYYSVDILNWYISDTNYTEGIQPLVNLFRYFFVYGGRYLKITTDKNKNLVFEFHSHFQSSSEFKYVKETVQILRIKILSILF